MPNQQNPRTTVSSCRLRAPRPLSAAPMMNRTDRHFRFFLRQISQHTLLYTEMITTGALLHGDRERHLAFDPRERPLALQLGGDDPLELAKCARLAAEYGYDEINLNVGCPSDRVQQGRFGACLMAEPERVARAVASMRQAVELPVTVKHRIGIDHRDSFEHLLLFVDTVAAAGCDRFTVHARKAWLSGLSPKENREIPPLRYADVYRLKQQRPELQVEINGGVGSLEETSAHLRQVDAVMIGRAAYDHPYLFADADRRVFGSAQPPPSRRQVVASLLPYVETHCRAGTPLLRLSRHFLGLFAGRPGTRYWKRFLSDNAHRPGAGPEILEAAMAGIPEQILDERPTGAEPAKP